jgi:hypothetical protein
VPLVYLFLNLWKKRKTKYLDVQIDNSLTFMEHLNLKCEENVQKDQFSWKTPIFCDGSVLDTAASKSSRIGLIFLI